MKVKKLIKLLSKFNPEAEVILSKDAEGNEFSPLDECADGWYIAESTWSGTLVHPYDLESYGMKEDEEPNSVVFWPVN